MVSTDFLPNQIVRPKGRRTQGYVHECPRVDGQDPLADVTMVGAQGRLLVTSVSTFEGRQRLLFRGIEAWFPAEHFTRVKNTDLNDLYQNTAAADDSELPGMWEQADFSGGKADMENITANVLTAEVKWLREALDNAKKLPFGYSYHFLEGFETAIRWIERHAQTPDIRDQPGSLILGLDKAPTLYGEDPFS